MDINATKEHELMWIRRILVIPAVATLAVSGAVLLGTAGTASAATTAPAVQPAVIAQPAILSMTGWVKYNYYSSELLCDLEGTAMLGEPWDGGTVVEYKCDYNLAEGAWELWLFVEDICPAGTPGTPPAKAAPDAKVSPNAIVC
jgi:hypothetical protein